MGYRRSFFCLILIQILVFKTYGFEFDEYFGQHMKKAHINGVQATQDTSVDNSNVGTAVDLSFQIMTEEETGAYQTNEVEIPEKYLSVLGIQGPYSEYRVTRKSVSRKISDKRRMCLQSAKDADSTAYLLKKGAKVGFSVSFLATTVAGTAALMGNKDHMSINKSMLEMGLLSSMVLITAEAVCGVASSSCESEVEDEKKIVEDLIQQIELKCANKQQVALDEDGFADLDRSQKITEACDAAITWANAQQDDQMALTLARHEKLCATASKQWKRLGAYVIGSLPLLMQYRNLTKNLDNDGKTIIDTCTDPKMLRDSQIKSACEKSENYCQSNPANCQFTATDLGQSSSSSVTPNIVASSYGSTGGGFGNQSYSMDNGSSNQGVLNKSGAPSGPGYPGNSGNNPNRSPSSYQGGESAGTNSSNLIDPNAFRSGTERPAQASPESIKAAAENARKALENLQGGQSQKVKPFDPRKYLPGVTINPLTKTPFADINCATECGTIFEIITKAHRKLDPFWIKDEPPGGYGQVDPNTLPEGWGRPESPATTSSSTMGKTPAPKVVISDEKKTSNTQPAVKPQKNKTTPSSPKK